MRPNLGYSKTTIKSAFGQGKPGLLPESMESQFMGFDENKNSFVTYCWKSPTSSGGSSPTSSMIGDGLIIRKPYRLASNIVFEKPEHRSKPKKKRAAGPQENSFDRLFGSKETRKPMLVSKNMFQTDSGKPMKSRKPLPVSPITGHVIGTGGSQMVELPKREVRSPLGGRHSPLW